MRDPEQVRIIRLRKGKVDRLKFLCDKALDDLVKDYPETVVKTFFKQEQEAKALDQPTPFLNQLSVIKGKSKEALQQTILYNSAVYSTVSGLYTACQQVVLDKITATKNEDLEVLNVDHEWYTIVGISFMRLQGLGPAS